MLAIALFDPNAIFGLASIIIAGLAAYFKWQHIRTVGTVENWREAAQSAQFNRLEEKARADAEAAKGQEKQAAINRLEGRVREMENMITQLQQAQFEANIAPLAATLGEHTQQHSQMIDALNAITHRLENLNNGRS